MSKDNPPIAKESLDKLPLASLYPNAKKFPPQKLINEYIKEAGRDPKAIEDMIKAKRNATKQVISKARDYYIDMSATLVQYNALYDKSSNKEDQKNRN